MKPYLYKRDVFTLRGYNDEIIGFDVKSAVTLLLNPIAEKILQIANPITLEKIYDKSSDHGFKDSDIKDTIEQMLQIRLINEEPMNDISSYASNINTSEVPKIGVLNLNISHTCNMLCKYCFASGGDYGLGVSMMSIETIKQSVDYLFEHIVDTDAIMVSIFGGEPLLNWNGIMYAINYANNKNKAYGKSLSFHITTNGTLFDIEKLTFLSKYKVSITVSLDGPKEINDKFRRFKDGESSFQKTVEGIKMITQFPQITLQVRPTIHYDSASKILEVVTFLESLGAKRIHMRPMSSKDGTAIALSEKNYGEIAEGFYNLAKKMYDQAVSDKKITGHINILMFLYLLYFRLRRNFYCGAGCKVVSVDPSGKISPCPRFTCDNKFQIGDINCKGVDIQKQQQYQSLADANNRPDCENCWAINVCAGGCLYMHDVEELETVRNHTAYCDLTRSTIKSAIQLFVALQEHSPDHIINLLNEYPPMISGFKNTQNNEKERRWNQCLKLG